MEKNIKIDKNIEKDINILGYFCGKRDIEALKSSDLKKHYNIEKADALVLFGGSILYGGDLLVEGIKNNIAKHYIIVGGNGHTTDKLRKKVAPYLKGMNLKNLSEAEIFNMYIKEKYNISLTLLEKKSTNCGNNITNLLSLLKKEKINIKNIIIMQDATMQRRMEAGLRKYRKDLTIINFATYKTKVQIKEGKLTFKDNYLGLWSMEEYINLLMGEIPRLSDNEEGYGPKGKNFIASVNIPNKVLEAFNNLQNTFKGMVRIANPKYASKE